MPHLFPGFERAHLGVIEMLYIRSKPAIGPFDE